MSKLVTLNNLDSSETIGSILNDEIIIFEDIQGSRILMNWDGSEFKIKPRSINNEPLNIIEFTMQNYYNKALDYFNSLDQRVKSLLNRKWWYCFEYFPDNQPGNIDYDFTPKNNLILTSVYKGDKWSCSIDELEEYSRLLNVDMIPVVYQGKLTERMKEGIIMFLNTTESDLEFVFGEKNFAFFFYKLLNPITNGSFLMEDDFQKNIEKLLIRTKNNDFSFEILNPLYKRISDNNSTQYVEAYTMILMNFLNFAQTINIKDIKLKGDKKDELYVYFICRLYNIYVNEVKSDILNFNFVIPEFFNKDKFKINTEYISNKLTKDYISSNPKLEYVFKIILSSFSKKRKKAIGIFTEKTVELFNSFVDDINEHIDVYMNKITQAKLTKGNLIDFGQFFDIKYDTDGEGRVHIQDIYDEFEKTTDKKKKGKLNPTTLKK